MTLHSGNSSYRVSTPTNTTNSASAAGGPPSLNSPVNVGERGVATQLRHASREAARNIKNRWSAGSPQMEEEHLLGATDTPTSTPRTGRHAPSAGAGGDRNTLPASSSQGSLGTPFNPTSAQLQKVIKNSLITSSRNSNTSLGSATPPGMGMGVACSESKLLSSDPVLLSSSAERKETIC